MGERYLVSAHCYLGALCSPSRRKYEIIRKRAHSRDLYDAQRRVIL